MRLKRTELAVYTRRCQLNVGEFPKRWIKDGAAREGDNLDARSIPKLPGQRSYAGAGLCVALAWVFIPGCQLIVSTNNCLPTVGYRCRLSCIPTVFTHIGRAQWQARS